MKRRLLMLLVGVLVACASAAAPAQLPKSFRGQPGGEDAHSIGDLGWWRIFGDRQLQKLIATAVAHNFDVRVAMVRVETARANVGLQQSSLWPQLNATGGANVTEQSAHNPLFFPGLVPRTTAYGQVLLNLLSFELDIWGRLRHQARAARAQLVATDAERQGVMTTVVSDVATTYFNLLTLDAQLEVDRQTLAARQSSLDIIRAREEGGVATLLDLRQAEQLVQTAQAAVPDTERQILQTENNLNLLLGNPPGPIWRGRPLTEQPQLPAVPAGLPSELLLRRPDIRAAEATLAAQNELVASARAAFFPTISLSGFFGFQSTELATMFTPAGRTFSLLPLVTQPIFDGGKLHSTLEIAKGNRDIARVQYQQAIATAFRDVSNALVAYQKTHQVRSMLEALVTTLQDRARLAYLRYHGGVDTLLNALDADRDLFTAQLTLAVARRDELLSVVQLYKALGGGWQVPAKTETHESDSVPAVR